MGRSTRKGPWVDPSLMRVFEKAKREGKRDPIKTWSRRSTVIPDFVGFTFAIHNGKDFHSVYMTEEMVGHKLGEFAPTRRFDRHGAHTKRVITPK